MVSTFEPPPLSEKYKPPDRNLMLQGEEKESNFLVEHLGRLENLS